jgi:hypothetical protein
MARRDTGKSAKDGRKARLIDGPEKELSSTLLGDEAFER